MIDYDKLKIVHELFTKVKEKYFLSMIIGKYSDVDYSLCPYDENEYDMNFDSIDLLIDKLTELTKPGPKYKVGQEVCRLSLSDLKTPISSKIVSCKLYDGEILYKEEEGYTFPEESFHPSKEALITAQIKYWQELRLKEFLTIKDTGCETNVPLVGGCLHEDDGEDECNHQDDGLTYYLTDPPQVKCWKCGEFYR